MRWTENNYPNGRNVQGIIWMMRVTFLAAALCASSLSLAAVNQWTPLGPDGGVVSKLVLPAGSATSAYAEATSGFFRSTDGGAHWLQNPDASAPYAQDFTVDPSDSKRLYLLVNTQPPRLAALNDVSVQVQLSTDSGATFSTVYAWPDNTPLQAIEAAADGNTLYVTDGLQIYRSTDRGQTWQARTALPASTQPGSIFHGLRIDPADVGTVYYVRSDSLFVSHDGGATWTNITPAGSVTLQDLAIDPTNTSRLWLAGVSGLSVSADRGASWSVVDGGWTNAIALDPHSPGVVYAADFEGKGSQVIKGNGTTWTDISGNLGSTFPSVIAVSPQDSSRIIVGNDRGLWVTSTGGGTWTRSDAGLIASYVAELSPAGARGRTYLSGTAIGALDDGSDTVTVYDDDALFRSGGGTPILLRPASESSGALIAAGGNEIVFSNDEGGTWSPLNYTIALPPTDFLVDLAASPATPSAYYASSQQTLQRSVDHGATWTAIVTGLPAGYSAGFLAMAPGNQSILYAGPRRSNDFGGTGAGVYKSTNSGDSWAPANTGIESSIVAALAVDPTQPNTVYAATNLGELEKTTDGGASWATLQTGIGVVAIAVDPANPNAVYAVGGGRHADIARSGDGGATWEHLTSSSNALPWLARSVAVDPGRPDTIRVGTSGAGIYEISLQPDLGVQIDQLATNVPSGTAIPYTVAVTNLGHLRPTGVVVTIQMPMGTVQLGAPPNGVTCAVSGSTVTCNAPTMTDAFTVTGAVTPSAAGTIQITATVRADQSDSNMTHDTATQSSNVVASSGSGGGGGDAGGKSGGGGESSPLFLLGLLVLMVARHFRSGPS